MSYLMGNSAADASATVPQDGRDDFWTFAAVQERLVEAMGLWRRSPGGGKWPFAGDAPWHLMSRKTRVSTAITARLKPGEQAEIVAQLIRQDDDAETRRREGRERRGPLTREEVARRDATTEWLRWCDGEDHKVVIEVLKQLVAGAKRIDWARVKRAIGAEIGNKGVYRRYHRSVSAIAVRLNGSKVADLRL